MIISLKNSKNANNDIPFGGTVFSFDLECHNYLSYECLPVYLGECTYIRKTPQRLVPQLPRRFGAFGIHDPSDLTKEARELL